MNFREAQEIARKAKADGSFKLPPTATKQNYKKDHQRLMARVERYNQMRINRELAELIEENEKARTITSGPMLSRQPIPKIKRGQSRR